jgi:hypothetical protein
MDKVLPQAHVEKLSQFSVPPLSAPLVLKTFKTNLENTLRNFLTNLMLFCKCEHSTVHLAVRTNKNSKDIPEAA